MPDRSGRVSNNGGSVRNVPGHDGASTDDCIRTNTESWQDSGAATDRGAFADACFKHGKIAVTAFRIHVIGKCDVRADEYVIADMQPIPQLYAVFNRDTVTDMDIVFDETMRANIAISADRGSG